MNRFNKKKDRMLIELVKKHPVLYDPGNSNFKNCIVKHKVWESISTAMEISVPDIKRRWKHFRDHFHKKLKAESAGVTTFHTWEYKTHLNFLTEFSNYKDKVKNKTKGKEDEDTAKGIAVEDKKVEDSDSDDTVLAALNERSGLEIVPDVPVQSVPNDSEVLEPEPAPEEVLPKKKKKEMDTLASVLESRLVERFRLETSKAEKSPIHKFFESMADVVAEFPPHLAAEARLRVCQVVNDIEMKKYMEQEFL